MGVETRQPLAAFVEAMQDIGVRVADLQMGPFFKPVDLLHREQAMQFARDAEAAGHKVDVVDASTHLAVYVRLTNKGGSRG